MFRKKKTPSADGDQPVLRGRATSGPAGGAGRKGAANPLARRLQSDSEPATVDLAAPARFHPATLASDDPKTAPLQTDTAKLSRLISHDPVTGKFYIHPGAGNTAVTLEGEAVSAPTELRPGDTIRCGGVEIHFHSAY